MSLLEFVNLTYTYDGQQPLLRGANGQLEQGKLYGILGPPPAAGKPRCSLCWAAWTAPPKGKSCSTGRTLPNTAWPGTGETMCPSCSKPIISSTTSPQ